MGSGTYSGATYAASRSARVASGAPTFAHSTATKAKPMHEWKADPMVDPKGVVVRESRDSDEHPTSTPIAVFFDVTGSMLEVPKTVIDEKMPNLFALLQSKGYVEHPQLLWGAIGDCNTDRVPLQVGQFESDNRIDETLQALFLEGNGGGQTPPQESYELGMYFMARHTVTDSWEKRGKKGYLFFIGDERAYPKVRARDIKEYIGGEAGDDIPLETIWGELLERWEVYFIVPTEGTYHGHDTAMHNWWRDRLGERLILVDSLDAITDLIGTTIGLVEGTVDLDEALEDLEEIGAGASKGAVGKALAHLGSSGGGGGVAVAEAPGDIEVSDDDATERV